MNFRKGDRVKFLNDVGQGEIVRFQDKNIAVVLNEDGFEIPVLMKELLKISGDYAFEEDNSQNVFVAKETVQKQTPKEVVEDIIDEDGLIKDDNAAAFFAMVPKNQKDILNCNLDTYLINDSNFRLMYVISKSEGELQSLIAYGNLESNTKVFLTTIKREELSAYEEINFQILFYGKGNYNLLSPVNYTWETRLQRFFKENTFTVNDFFNEKAYVFEIPASKNNLEEYINDADLEKSKKEKERTPARKQFKSSKEGKNAEVEEVDLHIHELTDDHSNLSNAEILDIQMSRFVTALDGGIIAGTKKMVFIHGIGNGRLKMEVSKTLDRKYPKLKYQDASFKEYGYGATIVMIK